eukprot:CAMPEP_0119345772 /NCGR_PEP_ID=MMETSP1333-20130426/107661_1 /TAXON_ID=418940 /ORGANISM="Scyphosphaera apsteinii, Strain RCC1455" /LENGTH=273 /DNA_ID=CAMNT_0007358255 /DNA_START=148 /DNA_END=969 /DNA_ORIENTATION=+
MSLYAGWDRTPSYLARTCILSAWACKTVTEQRWKNVTGSLQQKPFLMVLMMGIHQDWPTQLWHGALAKLMDQSMGDGRLPVVFIAPAESRWEAELNKGLTSEEAKKGVFAGNIVLQHHGLVLPMSEVWARAFQNQLPRERVGAPLLDIFEAFMGTATGKAGQNAWLRAHGMGAHCITEYSTANVPKGAFPVMLKPAHGGGGNGIVLVDNKERLLNLTFGLRVGTDVVIQEAVQGTVEWGVYFVAYKAMDMDSRAAKVCPARFAPFLPTASKSW